MTTVTEEDVIRDISRRKRLADKVSNMGTTEHEQILRIIHSNGIRYTRNNNGVFCDITRVPDHVLDMIEQFISYSAESAKMLEEKRVAPASSPPRKRKEKPPPVDKAAQAAARTERVRTFVNSMTKARTESSAAKRKETCRYQQLRKKYSRPVNPKTSFANDLQPE
nr:hypothetical protein TetV2_00098 [Oceanusvirus sp.]